MSDRTPELRSLFDRAEFEEVVEVAASIRNPSQQESHILGESLAALELERQARLPVSSPVFSADPSTVLCVMHASAPYQSGGYAVRAHGIIKMLGDSWSMVPVTRPGFPQDTIKGVEFSEVSVHDGVAYRHLRPVLRARKHGEMRYMLDSVLRYEEVMREVSPAVVHLRSTYLIALPGLIAARRLGIPVLYEVSGLWELVYAGRATEPGMLGRANRSERMEAAVARSADRAVTLTSRMREILISRGADPSGVEIAPNAVDFERFARQPGSINSDVGPAEQGSPGTIGYVGTFVDYEGLDLLVRALRQVRDKGVEFRALLVGDGKEFQTVKELVTSLQLEDLVEMPGRLPHDLVSALYQRIDICPFPRKSTPATEAVSPLKPFEALASGKAIVVSPVAALSEFVRDGVTGLVMREHTVEELAYQLERLIADRPLRRRLALQGQQWVAAERSWKKAVAPIEKFYTELGGSRVKRRTAAS